jgi:hypothetical protein
MLLLVAPIFSSSVQAAGDLNKPYRLRIVVAFAENQALTPVFRDRVRRELQDGIQAAFGDLAVVEVVSDHPRLPDIRKLGLGRGLDGWNERSEYKTHFVLIDERDGQYELQARQHDGPTAQPGPLVRVDHTNDREFVARTASLLIERDFGFTATFDRWPAEVKGQLLSGEVKLRLKGAGLGVPLSRWVRKGDVFAVVQESAGSGPGRVVPWAVVQVEDEPGADATCSGRLFWRFTPTPPATASFRCLKLGVKPSPVRLRIVQSKPGGVAPLENALSIQVRRHGFEGDPVGPPTLTDALGNYSTAHLDQQGLFDRLAFVTVSSSDRTVTRAAVPLLDDKPVVLAVTVAEKDNDLSGLRADSWRKDVAESHLVHISVRREIAALAEKGRTSHADLLEKARAALDRTREDQARLSAERDKLTGDGVDPKLLEGQARLLKQLEQGATDLDQFVKQLEQTDREENKPERKAALDAVGKAQLAEANADYEEAIHLLEGAQAVLNDDGLAKRIAKLKDEWTPKDEALAEARRYIYQDWARLDTEGLERELPTAEKALQTCKRFKDRIGPRKLLLLTEAHASRLTKELEVLRPELKADDEKAADQIKKVSEGLVRLTKDALNYLETTQK